MDFCAIVHIKQVIADDLTDYTGVISFSIPSLFHRYFFKYVMIWHHVKRS